MKNMGDMRREIKQLKEQVDLLERQMAVIIDTFCKDAFENFEPPEKKNDLFNFKPEDVQIDDDDLPYFGL